VLDAQGAVVTKVLAVDDDPVIQRLLQVNLEMEGYEVATASDGEEALERARSFKPDVILLDIMMPKKDGWQVCAELKNDPALEHVPVVFLSARAQDADIQRGTELGVAAYVTKPFDPIDLLELVADLATQSRT
jgi:CheY-like chemotaxis protein